MASCATSHDCFAEHGQVAASQIEEDFMASWAGQLVLGCLAQDAAAALWPLGLWPAPWRQLLCHISAMACFGCFETFFLTLSPKPYITGHKKEPL